LRPFANPGAKRLWNTGSVYEKMSIRITFDDSARAFILDTFGKADRTGFVVEKKKTDQKVLTPRGEEIPLRDFAGMREGSVIFVKSDIVSLIEAAMAMEK